MGNYYVHYEGYKLFPNNDIINNIIEDFAYKLNPNIRTEIVRKLKKSISKMYIAKAEQQKAKALIDKE